MSGSGQWFVYILQCSDGTLYTGVTTDTRRRLAEHNHGPKGARYTRARRPVVMVYSEPADSRSEACTREAEIRRLDRAGKTALIEA